MKNLYYFFLTFLLLPKLTEAQSYKMISYNIRYDNPDDGENKWELRKDDLCNQLKFYSPDVFGIQEGLHHQVSYIDHFFANYKYVGIGREDGKTRGEYSAIFYNTKKLKIIQQATFWLSKTPYKISIGWDAALERICTYALLQDIKTQQHFWVFNTHFDHLGNKARLESAKLIINKINTLNKKQLPVILMGDLNLDVKSKAIQYLSSVLNDSKTNSTSKPFGPVGTFNDFNFNKPVTERIDYIFTDKKQISVLKYAVLSNPKNCKYPSDHLPVYIEYKIKKKLFEK